MLISSFLPSKTLILLGASCLVWAGIISAGLAWFAGAPLPVGWIIAGLLFAVLAVFCVVMFRELQASSLVPEEISCSGQASRSDRRIAFTKRRPLMAREAESVQPACGIRLVPRANRLLAQESRPRSTR